MTIATSTTKKTDSIRALLVAVAAYSGAHDSNSRDQNHPADALDAYANVMGVGLDEADRLIQYTLVTVSTAIRRVLMAMFAMRSWHAVQNRNFDADLRYIGTHELQRNLQTAENDYYNAIMATLEIEPEAAEACLPERYEHYFSVTP